MNRREKSRYEQNCDLKDFVRPLANYICANEQPGTALRNVLAAVLHEVRETNRAARAQFGTFTESCCT